MSDTPDQFVRYRIYVTIDGPELAHGTPVEVTLYGTVEPGSEEGRRLMVEDWRGPAVVVREDDVQFAERIADLERQVEVLQAEILVRPRP